MEYPKSVEETLAKASEKSGMPIENLKQKYNEYYDGVKEDPAFLSEEKRHEYCSQILWNNYGFRTPMSPHDIVPLGFETPRMTKGGRMATLFAFDIAKQKMIPVVIRDKKIQDLKHISVGSIYKDTDLGENKDGSAYFADDRTSFKDPVFQEGLQAQLMTHLKIPVVKISEAINNLSKKDSAGYVDKLDWKCINGFIFRDPNIKTEGVDKKGNPAFFAIYTVNDASIRDGIPAIRTTDDGSVEVTRSGMTVFINPWLAKFPKDCQCYFYGTLEANENKEVSMRAFVIIFQHGPYKES